MSADTLRYSIRRFLHHDVELYKALRLEALHTEPGMFGNPYNKEAAFSEEEWQARVSDANSAVFGLYHSDELVGITGIFVDASVDPATGYMTQSYIRRAHRGRGLSRMLYETRMAWARERRLRRLTIGHRESNLSSKASIQRHCFRFTHREDRLWPDGAHEAMIYYLLEL